MTPGPASSSPRFIGLLMLALFPAVAVPADLVNLKLDWPTLEYKCSNSSTTTFKVVGPAIVNFRLEVAPYRTAGRIIRSTGNYAELNDRGESITDWALGLNVGTELLESRTTQKGVEVRNPVEDGPPLVTESTWNFFEARTYWYAVRMSPPCDTTSNLSHVSQPGQRAKLVVRYGEGSGASDRARAMLAGRWLVTLNQYPGTLEMIRKGDGWIARLDGVDMSQVNFDPATGRLTFVRPTSEGDQRFQGTVAAGSISGTFDQGGVGRYTWHASRPGATPAGHTARHGTPIGATAQGVDPTSPVPASGTPVQAPAVDPAPAGPPTTSVRVESLPVPVISCSSTGQVCVPPHSSTFEGAGELWISYTAGPLHCSDVAVRIRIDELPEQQTGLVSAGQTTEPLRFMLPGGTHRLAVTGVGRAGGCNTGAMLGWTGSLALKWASQ